MFSDVNEIAVVVTALLCIAVGSIWYSPLVFGKYWMSAARLTGEDLSMTRGALIRSLTYAGVANIVFVYVIARLIARVASEQFFLLTEGSLLILLIAASMASVVVWEKKSFTYLAIHIGYVSLVVCTSIVVLSLWPW
jgi:hypothetical protein